MLMSYSHRREREVAMVTLCSVSQCAAWRCRDNWIINKRESKQ